MFTLNPAWFKIDQYVCAEDKIMLNFPGSLRIEYKEKSKLSPEDSELISKGFTPKTIMQDQEGHSYIAKSPDPLTAKDVFNGYVPPQAIDELDPKTKRHIFSLEFEGAFLELLIPNVMKGLFGDLMVVPEVYLHVGQNNQVILLSKILSHFDEFLHQKVTQKFGAVLENSEIPRREQLDLNEDDAFFIGQIYAAALIFNHWDILNSKFLNSGKIRVDNQFKACIVDFGFCGHLSYKGRHNDSLCIDDENFTKGKKINYRFFTSNYLQDYRHRFALPFDGRVGTLLPHTIIENLFDLSGNNPISLSMRKGFATMVEQAIHNLESNPNLYETAFNDSLNHFSKESSIQPQDLGEWINMSYYHGNPQSDTLFTIISDRVYDCQRLLNQFNQGVDAISLHEETRDHYVQHNMLKSI
ncbi:hypothetical protein [Legionella sp. W05-934-2]|jgi:hypothetical protein|uniref:hypothetical protein n=1 Tax=Legionella sp. W05-934-2 TaxID=1198649 RepID=UPI0034638346